MNTARKLRALGSSLLSLLAVGAVSASAAQAGEFEAGVYPATITGQNINGPHEITTELGVMGCAVNFEGELTEASEDLTLTPEFLNCVIAGNPVDVATNGCDFRINAGATLFMDMVEGSLDVICPEGNAITFGITVGGGEGCRMKVPEQLGLGEVTLKNTTMAQDMDVVFNIEGMAYELGPNCPVAGAFANGEYAGESTLRAHNEAMGTPLGVK
ncbi:MAG TPA: hypothetical protein VHI77_01810 [Solirubrobacterales bacterium]|jgi:hypothetical protein|nr:hypothetical protein [Solirubrobacterales bacterium]